MSNLHVINLSFYTVLAFAVVATLLLAFRLEVLQEPLFQLRAQTVGVLGEQKFLRLYTICLNCFGLADRLFSEVAYYTGLDLAYISAVLGLMSVLFIMVR